VNGMFDRIRGALYGVAVGDALGAPLEFMTDREIVARYGFVRDMIGGGWLNVQPGEVTDDTQLTLAVAEGILAAPDEPYGEIGRRFIEWLAAEPKDAGNTCRASISRAARMIESGKANSACTWLDAARSASFHSGGRSGGNGALMRTVYPALYYRDLKKALEVAYTVGRMTHYDEASSEACALYVGMVHACTAGDSRPDLAEIEKVLEDTQYCAGRMARYRPNPAGYVVDSMMCALDAFRATQNFEDAVARAANLGGDADTIAAIAGGLAGAFYGFDSIPVRWVEALEPGAAQALERCAAAAFENRAGKREKIAEKNP